MLNAFFHKIGIGIFTIATFIGGLFGSPQQIIQPAPTENVGATIPVTVAVFQTSLQTGITASDTSMTLVTGTDKAGNSLSGYTCFNIDEGSSLEEFVCGTASGTSITSMIRGIDPVDGDLEVTALKKRHGRGASVKITNYPSLGIISRIINGTETLPNKLTYASAPTFSAGNELITKTYADALAIAGAPDASTTVKGIGEEATEAEVNAGTAAGGTSARLFVNPSTLATSNYATRLPTANEKSALVGNNTDIAVGSGNKYVTQTGMQHGTELYAADAGANDTYVITLSPVPTSYTNGMVVRFKANTANTGAATINVNSLGAKTIVKYVNTTLADGDIAALSLNTLIYDGTNFVLQNPIANLVSTDSLLPSVPNTVPTGTSTYHTFNALPTVYNDGGTIKFAGAAKVGTITSTAGDDSEGLGGGSIYLTSSANGALQSQLPSLASTVSYRLLWSEVSTNPLYFKFKVAPRGNGSTPTYAWGLSSGGSDIYTVYNSTTPNSARFVFDGTTLYAVSSKNAVGATTTNVTGALTIPGKWHIYEIVITSTYHKFYIDGVLVATHTTNLPTAADNLILGYGLSSGSTTEMAISPTIISMPNTAN